METKSVKDIFQSIKQFEIEDPFNWLDTQLNDFFTFIQKANDNQQIPLGYITYQKNNDDYILTDKQHYLTVCAIFLDAITNELDFRNHQNSNNSSRLQKFKLSNNNDDKFNGAKIFFKNLLSTSDINNLEKWCHIVESAQLSLSPETLSFLTDDSEKDDPEVLLDYYLSYTLRCAQESSFVPPKVKDYSKNLIIKLLLLNNESEIKNGKNITITNVKTWKQWRNIDVCAEVTLEVTLIVDEKEIKKEIKYAICFENKVYTHIHSDQLKKYQEVFENFYQTKPDKYRRLYFFLTYYSETQEKEEQECKKYKFEYLKVENLKYWFVNTGYPTASGSEIFDEFWFKHF